MVVGRSEETTTMKDEDDENEEEGMGESRPWFKFWVDDFLNDEAVLLMTNEQVGVYVRLLCRDWREGSLPSRWEFIARLVGIDPNDPWWADFVELIRPKYIEIEKEGIARLTHNRLDRERVNAKRTRAGAKAASEAARRRRMKTENFETEVGAEPETEVAPEPGPEFDTETAPETAPETGPGGRGRGESKSQNKRFISGDPREDSPDPSQGSLLPKVRDIWMNSDGSIDARDGYLAELQKDYPGIVVERELRKASNWHKTQAPSNRKKRLDRFFVNWLNRCRSRSEYRNGSGGGGGGRHATPSRNLDADLERQRRLEAEERGRLTE
jgi:uncharacterized protein YdaU (DUF1376 family)